MALRQIQLSIPVDQIDSVRKAVSNHSLLDLSDTGISGTMSTVTVLIEAAQAEALMDMLDTSFGSVTGFRVVLWTVDATLPRPPPEPPPPAAITPTNKPEPVNRISREELRNTLQDATKLGHVYLVMAVLSSVVAVIGLLESNVAVIIGAMVTAPLLGPNIALALAVTLGDLSLARRALAAGLAGFLVVLIVALSIGFFGAIDVQVPQIAMRTSVGLGDVMLALASGAAGALAFTTAVSVSLVGVMVAVAMVPPLVVFGLLLGSGHMIEAWGALELVSANVICVNLAGVIVFLLQGIRPRTWWEADRAKRATRIALAFWAILPVLLVLVITFIRHHG